MAKTFSIEEVSKHNSATDCWIIIDGKVYNVTDFLNKHPGGKKVVLNLAGKDATKEFQKFHDVVDVLKKYGPDLYIGDITGAKKSEITTTTTTITTSKGNTTSYGELIAYGDPSWYQNWNSPYYKESHRKMRSCMREFVEKEITPFCNDWDEAKALPKELWIKSFDAGWLSTLVGPPWPKEYVGSNIMGGVKPEEFDAFHELIVLDELSRCGSAGVLWGIVAGLSIGLPPIMHFGSKYLQDKVCKDCLSGKKFICLCITEPAAGSDVANIECTAKKTPDGRHYIVSGEKKFITNGVWSDYFTVAVRTGSSGMGGISLLLIERTMPGVSTRQMHCSGVWASGTSYITFEDVKVPVENLIGKENQGFKSIMYNFNHERWAIIIQCTRFARVCYEDAFKYAHKRKTFGQRLVDHPVIRLKLGHMARQIEATQAFLENITFQLCTMSHEQAVQAIGGAIALLKVQSTQVFEFCAREAFQIFGGVAYTRGSQGQKIERLYREVRAYAIAGGSEEIMLDLGIRQAMKQSKL